MWYQKLLTRLIFSTDQYWLEVLFAWIRYLLTEVQFLTVSRFDTRHDKQVVFSAFRSRYIGMRGKVADPCWSRNSQQWYKIAIGFSESIVKMYRVLIYVTAVQARKFPNKFACKKTCCPSSRRNETTRCFRRRSAWIHIILRTNTIEYAQIKKCICPIKNAR